MDGIDMTNQPQSDVNRANKLQGLMRECTCPACGHHVSVGFFNPGDQTLAMLAWPTSTSDAINMPRLPHDFVRCVDCGHVYNAQFDYRDVPYTEKPNLMYNKGAIWSDHLTQVRDLILSRLPENPTVVEIGCGEGHLLRAVAEKTTDGRFIGFDPNSQIETGNGLIEARAELFEPTVHLAELQPDLIVSRHVFEHLTNPLGFTQALAFAAGWLNRSTQLLIEVPCIDGVLQSHRTVDFYYEHHSHFTTKSLQRMLSRAASHVEHVATGYNGEVAYGIAEFHASNPQIVMAQQAIAFKAQTTENRQTLRRQFQHLSESGLGIAIWGGSGKAAAFINQHSLDRNRFPLVVDSDPLKEGTFVPGTGQRICYRDTLLKNPVEIVIIATQWRAADIAIEMEKAGIKVRHILVEHQGRLVEYDSVEHPYQIEATMESPKTVAADTNNLPSQTDEPIRRPKFLTRRKDKPTDRKVG